MKKKLSSRTTNLITWVSALLIAMLTASTYTFSGSASPIATTGLVGFGGSNNLVVEKNRPVMNSENQQMAQIKALYISDVYTEYSPEPVSSETAVDEPVVEEAPTVAENIAPPFISLSNFASSVSNGNGGQITGLYAENIFALSVVQQGGNAAYVSTAWNTATQFSMASALGFLAHNYLAGSDFFSLYSGALISVVYGDGHSKSYRVSQIRKFQALSPESPYSDFVDLATGGTLSATDLFYQTYGVSGQVVLQTCISSNGIGSWGRLFVIATPAG